MPVSAALPETLKAITATKIQELSKQRENYEATKREIVNVAAKEPDLLAKVRAVVDGSCRMEGFDPGYSDDDELGPKLEDMNLSEDLRNKRRILRQAMADPSFSKTVLRQLGEEISRDLELKSQGHIHAEFFSKLVTQWLSETDGVPNDEDSGESPIDKSASFEEVGRKEMHTQRMQFESLIFERQEMDQGAITAYLERLFKSNKAGKQAHKELSDSIKHFCATLEAGTFQFDPDFLKTAIQGLQMTDLLSNEKTAILKQFLSNKEVMSEICDVLNMRLASLSTWKWSVGEDGAIPLEMRLQLNGKFRFFMDEDVLDAVFLHGIGLKLAVAFKTGFNAFFSSQAWLRSNKHLPKVDRERREYFFDEKVVDTTVQTIRRRQFRDDYFMTQLPSEVAEGARAYDSDLEDEECSSTRKGPLEIKHSLLHLLIVESLLARGLRGEFTVIRSDFKWFGPSLSHSTIFAVLRFFRVTEPCLDFFRRFLEAPMRFTHDGPDGAIKTRARGVPMSHALSDVFGEVMLFCMDYAVNQKTSGSFLYRLHDDFWFWGQESTCRSAWESIDQFARVMGIEFNQEKTGTVRMGSTESVAGKDPLPKGDVRWGFLKLDATSCRFLVDQKQVDTHISELRNQLSHCGSIFSYIQAYNAYLAKFFTNNFGKPSFGFGRAHIDMMIETFARIQRSLFPEGSVTDYLRHRIEAEFGVKDLPDGFFYFPNRMGGLELRNPLIPLFCMRDSCTRTPTKMLQRALDRDEQTYHSTKEDFTREDSTSRSRGLRYSRDIVGPNEVFMPLEEYLRYREERSTHLASVYGDLLSIPDEKALALTKQIAGWLESLGEPGNKRRRTSSRGNGKAGVLINTDWGSMEPYWKWVLAVNGGEIVRKYGGLRLVDEGKVPVGVVEMMKQKRVRWKG